MLAKFQQKISVPFNNALDRIAPLGLLLARIWIAKIFFFSGLTKIESWESTVALFTQVYSVPLLPPYFAALLGTGAELVLPALLILGLGGRVSIFVFFMYNLMCVASFHFLWTPQGLMGLDQHINWGLLLLLLMLQGPGKLSLDHLIQKKWPK